MYKEQAYPMLALAYKYLQNQNRLDFIIILKSNYFLFILMFFILRINISFFYLPVIYFYNSFFIYVLRVCLLLLI